MLPVSKEFFSDAERIFETAQNYDGAIRNNVHETALSLDRNPREIFARTMARRMFGQVNNDRYDLIYHYCEFIENHFREANNSEMIENTEKFGIYAIIYITAKRLLETGDRELLDLNVYSFLILCLCIGFDCEIEGQFYAETYPIQVANDVRRRAVENNNFLLFEPDPSEYLGEFFQDAQL